MALSTIGWSQAPTIDSLKRVISKTKIDSVKVNTLVELSRVYLDIDLNQAIEYGKQARKLAKKADFKKGQGNAYKAIVIGYYRQSNYPEAIVQYQNALDIYQKID
jgi:tetratricopeptide (TPR) repeat protein